MYRLQKVKLFIFEERCRKIPLCLGRKAREGSGIFPFSHTRMSIFPVRSICFLYCMRFKNEEGSCSIFFPLHAFLLSLIDEFAFSLACALRTRKVHVVFPLSCTRFSTFRNQCICGFPSRKRFKCHCHLGPGKVHGSRSADSLQIFSIFSLSDKITIGGVCNKIR